MAAVFKRVQDTRLPCARNLVRIFPLQHTFYPNMEELDSAVESCIMKEFGYKKSLSAPPIAACQKRPAEGPADDDVEIPECQDESSCDNTDVKDSTAIAATEDPKGTLSSGGSQLRRFNLFFNRRNNDVVVKQTVLDKLWAHSPEYLRYNYKMFEVS